MRVIWQSALSVLLGFAGGIVAMNVELRYRTKWVMPIIRAETIQANRFEVVGTPGLVLADWGLDPEHGGVVIAFQGEGGKRCAEFGTATTRFEGRNLAGFEPFMAMLGPDGNARVQVRLDEFHDPVLTMGDRLSEGRLLLGHTSSTDTPGDNDNKDPWDKWSLIFRDPSHGWKDYVDIGATTPLNSKLRTAYVVLRDSSGHELRSLPK
jgi:hypothetical protein